MKRDADWGLNDLYCSGPLDETNWPLTSNRGTQETTLPTQPSEVAKSHHVLSLHGCTNKKPNTKTNKTNSTSIFLDCKQYDYGPAIKEASAGELLSAMRRERRGPADGADGRSGTLVGLPPCTLTPSFAGCGCGWRSTLGTITWKKNIIAAE